VLTCYMCGQTKPETDFAFADMARGTRQRHCRKCQASYRRAHYLANRDDYLQREIARMAGYRVENRALILAYLLAHPCTDCGETDPLILDFDHRDPSSKRTEVARLASRKPWPQVLVEIQKCDVRCANCHRKRTARQFLWGKLTRSVSSNPPRPERERPAPPERQLVLGTAGTKRCCTCGEEKPLDQFAMKDKGRGLRATKCRACQRAYSREHYKRNRAAYLQRAARRRKLDRESCRQNIYEYLATHTCVDCGETDPVVLDFDHRDPTTKRGTVSRLAKQLCWAQLKLEIARCDVRCANCHRRRTAAQFSWSKLLAAVE
jgi:hypothetical protein